MALRRGLRTFAVVCNSRISRAACHIDREQDLWQTALHQSYTFLQKSSRHDYNSKADTTTRISNLDTITSHLDMLLVQSFGKKGSPLFSTDTRRQYSEICLSRLSNLHFMSKLKLGPGNGKRVGKSGYLSSYLQALPLGAWLVLLLAPLMLSRQGSRPK